MIYDSLSNLQPLLKRLPGIANLVLAVAIGLAGARLFWLLWPIESLAFPTATTITSDNTLEHGHVDINSITALNLFGHTPLAGTASNAQKVITAPETRLDLTLTGVVATDASESSRSRALIKNKANEQRPYAVGDIITGQVKLHAIYPTHVILDRNGRYETLTLEQLKENGSVKRVQATTSPDDIGATLAAVRQEILQRPSTITKYMRLRPAKQNGELIGYRIYPGPNRSLFQKLGLQPGAIVTKVNGTPLTNPQNAMQSLNQLATAPRITVTLKRGNNRRTISVNFK